ncbi:hypothetical protein SODALDRAFT_329783 [Sodiomyces alkalinus F11]|uniref:Secreted protein n=1 Tax=Sodiomyces alkalinus (strain CBS 110278 / VKM F-3762 / F11) TaxID=1314773 RepID=A0A3N2PJC1_SODAK|nr:hypothetical protein SODALDRAFT_329783 [Sodiomyces alkalinus F11]ROT34530.1 hypothetical protein SODALDRAFT_329783 [Sodiomyces alkalinus F11]
MKPYLSATILSSCFVSYHLMLSYCCSAMCLRAGKLDTDQPRGPPWQYVCVPCYTKWRSASHSTPTQKILTSFLFHLYRLERSEACV